ncbi:MAG: hypothetical protein ACFFER_20130, partial [Candidatus Thorarchaeota archaeon]
GIIMVEGTSLKRKEFCNTLNQMTSHGRWVILIPPHQPGVIEFDLNGQIIEFEILNENRKSQLIYTKESATPAPKDFRISSRLSARVAEGSIICYNENEKPVVIVLPIIPHGGIIICTAEINRIAPDTSTRDVRQFIALLALIERKSWFRIGIEFQKHAAETLQINVSEEEQMISLVAFGQLRTEEAFSFDEYFTIVKEMDPETTIQKQYDLLNMWEDLGVILSASGRYSLSDRYESRMSRYNLTSFLRRL